MSNFDLEKYRSIGGVVKGGTPKFASPLRSDLLSQCRDRSSPIAQMVKDPVMFRQIKAGKGSDKSLKKDAEYIQRTYTEKKKSELKAERFKPVIAAREKYKCRYHTEPI